MPELPRRGALRASAWSSIVSNTGWLLGGKVIAAILSLVYLGLATRSLGPEAFGRFILVLATAQAVATLVSCETWQLLMRYGMEPLRAGRDEALGRLFAFCTVLDLAGALVGIGIAIAVVSFLGPLLGWSSATQREALILSFVLLASIRSAATGVLRLHDRFGAAAFAETVMPVVRLIGALVVIAGGATVSGFLVAWAMAEAVTALVHWVLAFRVIHPRADWWRWQSLRAVAPQYPGLWHYAAVTNLASTLGMAGKQVAVLLVGASVGAVAAGGYRIAHQLGQAIANVTDMLSRATHSEIMRARDDGKTARLPHLFRHASVLAVITGVTMVAFMLVFGRTVLDLITGEQYASIYPLLLLLGAAAAVDAAGVAFEPALLATGRGWLNLRLKLVTTVVLLVLLVVLLNRFGTLGAAAATLMASIAGLALLGRAAWQAVRSQATGLR